MAIRRASLVILAAAAAVSGCADNSRTTSPRVDAGETDGGMIVLDSGPEEMDAGPIDGGEVDGGELDGGEVDGGELDGGEVDGGELDAGELDAGEPDAGGDVDAGPAIELDAVGVEALLATGGSLGGDPIDLGPVAVTYVRPLVGGDPAGFFVQAGPMGPAVFVQTGDEVSVGDVVTFTVTAADSVGGVTYVAALSDLVLVASDYDVDSLVQDVTLAEDLVSALDSYTSELVHAEAVINGTVTSGGTGFRKAPCETAGIFGSEDLVVRVPTEIAEEQELMGGCRFEITSAPLWRFNSTAELQAWTSDDILVTSCPSPAIESVAASSSTSVVITFSRTLDASSVLPDGSQFTFSDGLTASAASVSGRQVTVTTSEQVIATTYTVTAASTLRDTRLEPVATGSGDSATFEAYVVFAEVVVNEVSADIDSGCDLIELRVVSAGTLSGVTVYARNSQILEFPAGFGVAANDYIVIHTNGGSGTCNVGTSTNETTSVTEQAAATFTKNYDTAYDWYASTSGLTKTNNVIHVALPTGGIMDGALFWDASGVSVAAASEEGAAVLAAAAEWLPVGGGEIPVYLDADFGAHAAADLDGTGTTPTAGSIFRNDNDDTNTKDDFSWSPTGATWGANNPGQTNF